MSKDDPDPAQTVARCSLGNPPETPVSQVSSLPSLGVPDHEQSIPFTPSLEHDQMVQDCFPPTSSKPDEAVSLNELGLLTPGQFYQHVDCYDCIQNDYSLHLLLKPKGEGVVTSDLWTLIYLCYNIDITF